MKYSFLFTLLFCKSILLFYPISAFLANNVFQTGDPRLFPLFCVQDGVSMASLSENTSTHQDITKEGVKLAILKYFSSQPDNNNTLDQLPEDASLSEVYQAYYGPCGSPERFLKAIQGLMDGAAVMDTLPIIKDDPRYHFDAEYLEDSNDVLEERFGQTITTILSESKFPTARLLLGRSLHTIQKFYSHTNWIELGNVDIQPDLGLPGGTMTNVSGPGDNTCDPTGLVTNKLTSGYNINHQVDGQDVVVPGGKCFHGSTLDDVGDEGINKDTGSTCFSPSAALHDNATHLAIMATEEYLSYLRSVIGDHAFAQLFDLSLGSALAIVIDVSSSMSDEIEAVKVKVAEIIEKAAETGSSPSLYVLVPFEDPAGPVTRETDPNKFLEAVNDLTVGGGTEMLWSAIQLGLTNSLQYSNIVVFTDEPGDDPERKDGVIALAESFQTQVSIVYSGGAILPDHQDICSATGGLCIEFSKVDANQIVDLLSSSVGTSKAIIAQYSNLTGIQSIPFEVDSTIVQESKSLMEIKLSGSLSLALMTSPSGKIVDLMDDNSIANSDLSIDIIINLEGILDFTFKPDTAGNWQLTLQGSTQYSVSAMASCTFSFLGEFRYLDMMSTHPNLRKLPGRPVVGSSPTLSITMSGASRNTMSQLNEIDGILFVNTKGTIIEEHKKSTTTFENDFIIQTTYQNGIGLTSLPFYVRLYGSDLSGNQFWRTLPTLFSPATTKVEVTASSFQIECNPCNTTSADFIIENYGIFTDIGVKVIDDQGYFTHISNLTVSLGENETAIITADFFVPCDAIIGTVSTITVTATSLLDLTSNSASEPLIVVGEEKDRTPPSCQIVESSENNCLGIDPIECSTTVWNLHAVIWDDQAGLGSVRVEPEGYGNLSLTNFSPGVTTNVTALYEANDCCNTKTTLITLDLLGNQDRTCSVEFELRNCTIIKVVDTGPTWMYVEWTKPCEFWDVDTYVFDIINLGTGSVSYDHIEKCDDFRCKDNITNLYSCTDYSLELVAYELGNPSNMITYPKRLTTTNEKIPSSPRMFSANDIGQTYISLNWSEPVSNIFCVDHYRICWTPLPTFAFANPSIKNTCKDTFLTSLEINNLEPCLRYHFTIAAVTPTGKMSRTSYLEASTNFDHPGKPTNISVLETGIHYITLQWQNPIVNPHCVLTYISFCYDTDPTNSTSKLQKSYSLSTWDNTNTIHNLYECTNYTCEVEAMAFDHWESSSTTIISGTKSSKPTPPVGIEAKIVSEREALVIWSVPESGARCVGDYLMTWNNDNKTQNGSQVIEKSALEGNIPNLLPCSGYMVFVQAITLDETLGDMGSIHFETLDVAPGLVQHLYIDQNYQDGFKAKWKRPQQDPQCAQMFCTSTVETKKGNTSENCYYMEEEDDWYSAEVRGKKCATFYQFTVSASTNTGIQGSIKQVETRTSDC